MSPLEDLKTLVRTRPSGIAFVADDVLWSYRRLDMMAGALAAGLQARGIGPGDRVALHLPSVPELAVAYFACFQVGAIAAPINNRLKGSELEHVLGRLRPALYIGGETLYCIAEAIVRDKIPLDRRFIVGPSVRLNGAQPWSALLGEEAVRRPTALMDMDAPALLLSTSGTTGQPKFVAHSTRSLSAITDSFVRLELDNSQTILSALPVVHVGGVSVLLRALRVGAPIVLLPDFHPDAVLDAIAVHRGSWLPGMPFMFDALLEAQRSRPRDVESLRFCVSGGDVCPTTLQRDFERAFKIPLRSLWGSTETMGSLIPAHRPGPVYRRAPGASVRLLDDGGNTVAHGDVGELAVSGPTVASGYWQRPGVIDAIAADGWFHTGDLMQQGDGDELWFVARKKDLIVRGGSNIAPAEVEGALMRDPRIVDAAVVGLKDPVLGQRVAAAVQLADGVDALTLEAIRIAVLEHLADFKAPEWIMALDLIPRNPMGKVDRAALGGMLLKRRTAPS